MTERINAYRDRILSSLPTICTERARFYTEAYKMHKDKPVIMKRAFALKETLEKMTIRIEPEELIVGNHSSRIYAAPIFPEYAVEWIIKELDDFEKRPSDCFFPDDMTKTELLEICSFWKGSTTLDKGRSLMTDDLLAIHETGIIRAEGNLTSGDAHIAAHFPKVLEKGLDWYIRHVEELLGKTDTMGAKGIKKYQYYKATLISLKALQKFIIRFSALAELLHNSSRDKHRIGELKQIASNCHNIAVNPPQGFYQALQLTYFLQLTLQIESNGHSLSLGRMDQYLYPFYKSDKEKGLLRDDFVMELLENTWLKLVSMKKIRSWSHTRFSAGGPLYQNVTIGGQLRDGSDGVNELSTLILKSVGETRLTQPNLSVRFHPGLNDDFLKECIEVIRLGFGMPAFNNDSIVIPSFREWGVEEEDAWDYSAIGCIEVAVPGRWGYRCTGKHFLNFMRVFMAALNDGTDPVSGRQFCKGTGMLTDFTEYSQLLEAWDRQVRYYARAGIAIDAAIDVVLRDEAPDILCSAFTEPCLERGLTIHEGGSKYDFESGLQVGIANLGDSLAAIKKLVFEEKRIGAGELMEALENNFEGSGGEKIRQILLNHAPKFGNDDENVDNLLVEAYDSFIDEISHFRTIREGCGPIGCRYYAGTSSISGNVPAGSIVPATPDGRKAWKPLAEGASPSSGADRKGPTAVMKSISKLRTDQILGGVLLNQKMTPAVLESEGNRQKLADMLHAFFDDLKGWHIQFNIVDRETLLAAQKHPEEHRDLIVRVAGYSAFFTNLSAETQNDIIARTQQVL
ncbi:glycyl radical protein [Oceanispirochaeta sp.]|jgi:pyruvate formate-lyase/glycerol dehydratase family glycyl radical enzyme|uniref:glycyl radical protein n=1 Tax=Oceanispirochaeta sp. TaxID=2035350 RepID=UPI00263879FF|nr:glycyl radical protein [Oceanispirochaeta sp.]MDA3958611.1 glycyl radical protein [Oceanispirochaeta sp.]